MHVRKMRNYSYDRNTSMKYKHLANVHYILRLTSSEAANQADQFLVLPYTVVCWSSEYSASLLRNVKRWML